jgi:hypothetical protein
VQEHPNRQGERKRRSAPVHDACPNGISLPAGERKSLPATDHAGNGRTHRWDPQRIFVTHRANRPARVRRSASSAQMNDPLSDVLRPGAASAERRTAAPDSALVPPFATLVVVGVGGISGQWCTGGRTLSVGPRPGAEARRAGCGPHGSCRGAVVGGSRTVGSGMAGGCPVRSSRSFAASPLGRRPPKRPRSGLNDGRRGVAACAR